jgi:hypothetical protein
MQAKSHYTEQDLINEGFTPEEVKSYLRYQLIRSINRSVGTFYSEPTDWRPHTPKGEKPKYGSLI